MGVLDWFRRPPPIADREALADFIDSQAAFLVQKGIYEYSRARAGYYSKILFAEENFQQAVEHARWRAYPLGLHPPKRAIDIPEQFVQSYFDLMPIHENLRRAEFPTTGSYLRVTLCNIHDELSKRLNTRALVGMLCARTG